MNIMTTPMMTPIVILLYGVLTLAGGVFAYMSVKSLPSIIAGGASGLLLIFAAYLMMRNSYAAGWWIALVVTLALLVQFVYRGTTLGFKFMPGGLMIAMSIIALVVLLLGRAPRANL